MKQQELNKLLQDIISQFKEISLPVSDNIEPEVLVNGRAKARFGSCTKTKEGFVIEVNQLLLNADIDHIKNVLAHEVLHTCKDCHNHGKKWKFYARALNSMYGYNITTTTSYEKMGLERPEKQKNYKYMVKCQSCGKEIYRQRMSKLITNTGRYRCTCGGILKSYKNEKNQD